jgi:hypothetical protein
MLFVHIRGIILLLLVVSVFIGCISFNTPPEWKAHFESLLANKDYSFPVTGEVVETKEIASVIEYSWSNIKMPLPEADILLTGRIYSPWYSWQTSLAMRPVKLKNQGDDAITVYFLPHYKQRYFWDGTVIANGHPAKTLIDFDVYAEKGGRDKHFILTKAALGEVRLEFSDPFDIFVDMWDPKFPYLAGYIHTPENTYRVYTVLDNYPDKTTYHNTVFFNPLQKFQILDGRDTVIAELEKDKYTVYDTAPEAERENLQYAVALLVAFRHSGLVMKNLEDSWGPPRLYRYVYPEA